MHIERSGSFLLAAAPERAFELFTPEGERAWVAGWEPEPLHAPGGRLDVEGAVFRTRAHGEETLWLVLGVERRGLVAEYARITPSSRLGTVRVRCREAAGGGARVEVRYRLTAIGESGERALAETTEEAFAETLRVWRRDTTRALDQVTN